MIIVELVDDETKERRYSDQQLNSGETETGVTN